jgi:hypothetical protein
MHQLHLQLQQEPQPQLQHHPQQHQDHQSNSSSKVKEWGIREKWREEGTEGMHPHPHLRMHR